MMTTSPNNLDAGVTVLSPPASPPNGAGSTTTISLADGVRRARQRREVAPIEPATDDEVAATKAEKVPIALSKKPVISAKEANAAARHNGQVVLSIAGLKKLSTLGKYVDQLGCTDLGRARIAISAERIDEVDAVLKQLDKDAQALATPHMIDTRLAIAKVRLAAAMATTETANALLKRETERVAMTPAPVLPGFAALQINNTVHSPAG